MNSGIFKILTSGYEYHTPTNKHASYITGWFIGGDAFSMFV
jgi:hypothetical protein